jgi:Flp pilus assembly protein TadG
MIRLRSRLCADERGLSAVEFALVAPVLLLAIIGAAQLGGLFMANAALSHSLAEGARYAGIFPQPTQAQIRERMTASRFGLKPANLSTPTITTGKSDGADYLEISVTYSVPLDFVLIKPPPVKLTQTRRVFVYPTT